MKILYISQYFPPEMGAPAARVSELAHHWVQSGHQVTVLTGFPNHPTGNIPPEYKGKYRRLVCREAVDNIRVVRTWLLPFPNRKAHERILNYLSFCLSASLTGSFLGRPDVIIASTPQLFVGLSGWWIGRIRKIPFVLEVRDLWPDSITASGMGREGSMPIRVIRAVAGFLYRSCEHIVVVTPAFQEDLVSKWDMPLEKISIVENGVETDLFTPDGGRDTDKSALGIQGRFVVSYIGTLGLAHGLSTVLQGAAQLQTVSPEIVFLFVGEGADKERLISMAQDKGLLNVLFLPQQPREKVPSIIRASDVCLVPLRKADVFKTVIPTKMLEFMACGRPVILGVDGQARQVLDQAQAGVFVEPENQDALVQAIKRLYQDSTLRQTLGRNGRNYIIEYLSREQTARLYTTVLEKVAFHWNESLQ
ncbi:MAG: glycosyltransferase family 4 protein [Deltaproteobacteria bacterium]|nr:glycosyltransferase family 4 protein [Deltaproteobacteria bacterium]